MEEKVYNRQITKLSLACRVVDEQQIERHYVRGELEELYRFDGYSDLQNKPTLAVPQGDPLLTDVFYKYKDLIERSIEHDSLLENKVCAKLVYA